MIGIGIYAPLTGATQEQLATAANAALRGETFNTGSFSADGADYVLTDPRLGVGKVVLLSPANTHAAELRWYVDNIVTGMAQIHFATAPASAALFNYVIIGHGISQGS